MTQIWARTQSLEPLQAVLSMLTFRDNGRGMTEKTWTERASRICRAADTQVDYTPDLAQTLSRFGGTSNPSHILILPH